MKIRHVLKLVFFSILLVAGAAKGIESLSVLLQKGIYAEETEGNLDAAVKIYEGIVSEGDANRSLLAQAHYRLGVCELKRGRKGEAAAAFRKLLDQFPDQAELSTKSRERLEEHGLSGSPAVIRRAWADSGAMAPGTISADGRFLSFIDSKTGDVGVRDLVNNQNRLLADAKLRKEPWERAEVTRLSRDGQQIAYTWLNHANFHDLRVVSTDRPDPRVVFSERSEWCWPADWSPDGKAFVAVIQDRKTKEYWIALIRTADGSMTKIKTLGFRSPSNLRLAPDGRFLAYSCLSDANTAESDIFILSLIEGRETAVVEHPGEDRLIDWSPDGQSLLFISDRRGGFDVWSTPVADHRTKREPVLVKAGVGDVHPIGISRDGSLYYRNSLRSDDLYSASVDFDSGKLAVPSEKIRTRFHGATASFRVPSNGYELSADGRLLATVRYIGERKVLHVVNLATREDRVFANLPPSDWHNQPFWLADNRNLLFRIMGIDQLIHLFLFDCVTGETRTIARDDAASRLEYVGGNSAEENAVFYVRRDLKQQKFLLLRHDLKTGSETTQKIQLQVDPEAAYRFILSPGRKFLFYVRTLRSDSGQNTSVAIRHNLQSSEELEFMRSTSQIDLRVLASQVAVRTSDQSDRRWLRMLDLSGEQPRERFAVQLPRAHRLGWWILGERYLLVESLVGDASGYQTELWTISTEDGTFRKTDLTVSNMHVAGVRGDGKQLYFHTVNHPGTEVWVMENFLSQSPNTK